MVNKDDAHRHIIQELTEPEEQIFRDFIKNQKPIELVIKKEMLSIFLAKNIIGQQLSTKAANSIWRKIKKKILEYNTKKINQLSLESFLRSNGVSSKKAQYISGIIFSPSTKISSVPFARNAECSTDLDSVSLILSPLKYFLTESEKLISFSKSLNKFIVSLLILFFE